MLRNKCLYGRMNTQKNPAAVALGKLGGIRKGFKYSAEETERRRARLIEVRARKVKKVV